MDAPEAVTSQEEVIPLSTSPGAPAHTDGKPDSGPTGPGDEANQVEAADHGADVLSGKDEGHE